MAYSKEKPTYRKRSGAAGASGHFLEINLLNLFKLQGDKCFQDFCLTGNLKAAGDFDDLVIQYTDESGKPNVIFLQAKSKKDPNHRVTIDQFKKNGQLDLNKYYQSYLKIQDQFSKQNNDDPIFRGDIEDVNCNFVIYTNAIRDESITEHVDEVEQNPLHIILEKNDGHAFTLKNDALRDIFADVPNDDEIKFVFRLMETISGPKCTNLHGDKGFQLYHKFFTRTVFVKNGDCWKFCDEFLDGNFKNRTLLKFRERVVKWYGENIENVTKTSIRNWQIRLPGWFGKTTAKFQKDLCDKFIQRALGNISENIYTVSRMNKKFMNEIAKLVGSVFVFDEDKAMFKLNDQKVDGVPGEILQYLTTNLDRPGLYFDFKHEMFPRLSLGFTTINSKRLLEFGKKLTILTGYPNDKCLEKIIKAQLGNLSEHEANRRYQQMNAKIKEWWEKSGDINYLTKGDEFFKGILSGIIFDLKDPLKSFTGRTEELRKLHVGLQNKVSDTHKVIISQMASVHGLGGIGKSELARQYAKECKDSYDGNVIWINADSHESMAEGFHRLCTEYLNISTQNVNGKEMDITSVVWQVYNYFRDCRSLFIFDNANHFKNGSGANNGIKAFLPSTKMGFRMPHVLITSRNHTWPSATVIELKVLKEAEAMDLVKQQLFIHDDKQDADVKELITQLQNFPLALQQALSYIRQRDIKCQNAWNKRFSICDYLTQFKHKAEELLDSNFSKDCLDEYSKTTFTTWNITLEEIEKCELGKEARSIFNTMAFLYSTDIPVEFFVQILNKSEEEILSVINLLHEYSMITLHEGKANIHRLVQLVTRLTLQDDEMKRIISETLSSALIHNENKLIIHCAPVWKFASEHDDLVNKFPNIPASIIHAFRTSLRYEDACAFGRESIKSLKRVLGNEHTSSLTAQFQLGRSMNACGKYKEALQTFNEVLDKMNRILGTDHPETLTTRSNIAQTLSKQGKYAEALCFDIEVLAKRTAILGADHPGTLISQSNLAHTLYKQGNYEQALVSHKEVLEKKMRILGADHPDTLSTQHYLARTLTKLGRYEEALFSDTLVLEKRVRIFGKDHPDTLNSQHNIAQTLYKRGKYEEALCAAKEVLEKRLRILGKDHPDTLNSQHNIATTLSRLGKYEEALRSYKEVLEKRNRILGKDHPDTLNSRHNIAQTLTKLGKYEEALCSYKEVLEKRIRILGVDHPDTIESKRCIAYTKSICVQLVLYLTGN